MKIVIALLAATVATSAFAGNSHAVSGYTRSDGTYVAPHMQSNPNGTIRDNYSTQPNVNPYTSQPGRVNPYSPRNEALHPNGTNPNYDPNNPNPY